MTEPFALLVFGIGLVGATAGLRRILKRHDEVKTSLITKPAEEITKG